MNQETDAFRNAFFDLPSRVFGETFVQPILYKILGDEPYYAGNECDALRNHRLKGEYKAVRVVFKTKEESHNSLMDKIIAASVPMSARIGSLKDIENGNIVANCQNIKPFDFDYLDYVLVDRDGFHIFEITSSDFRQFADKKEFPSWSPNHGRKEKGKNGQFPIKSDNLQWHLEHTFLKSVGWDEVKLIASKICVAI